MKVNTPFDQLPAWTNPKGFVYRKVSFDVQMTSTGVSMKWKTLINGEEVSSDDVDMLKDQESNECCVQGRQYISRT